MKNSKNKNLFLDPNEMAIRKIYWPLFEKKKIRKVFRPGSRPCGAWRGYCERQRVIVRAIENVGADWAGIGPKFAPGKETGILIKSVIIKKIGELMGSDFVGSSPDVRNVSELRYHLGALYNLYPDDIGPESLVTILNFDYE